MQRFYHIEPCESRLLHLQWLVHIERGTVVKADFQLQGNLYTLHSGNVPPKMFSAPAIAEFHQAARECHRRPAVLEIQLPFVSIPPSAVPALFHEYVPLLFSRFLFSSFHCIFKQLFHIFFYECFQFMAFSHEPAAGYQHFPGVLFHHVRLPFFGHTFMASYHYAAGESLVMGTCIRHPVTTGGNDHPAGVDLVNVDTLKCRAPNSVQAVSPFRACIFYPMASMVPRRTPFPRNVPGSTVLQWKPPLRVPPLWLLSPFVPIPC